MRDKIDWDYFKAQAKAEKEAGVIPYVHVTIEKGYNDSRKVLHTYDIPREFLDKYRWVIRWRYARFVCIYPRENINIYYSFYDKKTGLSYGYNSMLSKYISAKAQVTKVENVINKYIESQRCNLFFNEKTDEDLIKAREKLATKKQQLERCLNCIRLRVDEDKNNKKLDL